ncbi:MAG: DNA methyltransferase [Rhodothermales bacterium]
MGKRKRKGYGPRGQREAFIESDGQLRLTDKSMEQELLEDTPVECLGTTFESDEARRDHFLGLLKEKLPELRNRPDFPVGPGGGPAADEDILRLSDPPYFTACPNPFLEDFIEAYGTEYDAEEAYHREPFAVDTSEGKTDQLYRAHGYHTKVPHLAIVPSILHYTEPGDIVLDGFCGSGMTGVAAQWCGTAPEEYRKKLEGEWKAEGRGGPQWGARRPILGDLSPAAGFIAANYNIPFELDAFARAARRLLDDVEEELGWMYETLHSDGKTKGRINYTVWSEVFTCPECAGEVVFVEEALDPETKRVRNEFPCPHCTASLTKKNLESFQVSRFDPAIQETVKDSKRVPVLIEYVVLDKKYQKKPDMADIERLSRVESIIWPDEIPTDRMMHASDDVERWGDKWRAGTARFSHVHHLFLPRTTHTLAAMLRGIERAEDARLRNVLHFLLESQLANLSIQNRFRPEVSFPYNPLSGVYYVPSAIAEADPFIAYRNKVKRILAGFRTSHWARTSDVACITTGDAGALRGIPDNSVDYIFTDPPFGDNLAYAELNFVAEAFHKVFTHPAREAIVSSIQEKCLLEYQSLMRGCFHEYCRVLKPGRWMTVVFHNSKNAVWNAIQEAMLAAGFVVADVRTLDKKQGSFNQVVAGRSVKQDLVISAYKPNHGLEERFELHAGTEDGAWEFLRTHLRHLPVFVSRDGTAEVIAERQNYLLFDRMVAFHVQRGATVPLSASEFYQGLERRFPERDGMYFLPEQAAEYDRKRASVTDVAQVELFVKDEESAIQWLKQQLSKKPQTFQELQPQFMKELSGWERHEKQLELSDILEENFLRYDGKGEVPSQIHSYLSSNFKDLRSLEKDDPALQAKAKDRWYPPDPRKAGDLEQLRERSLLREFEEYRTAKKKLKVFRLEAVRAGFKRAWQDRDYATIIAVAEKIPERVLQEDPKLLMWYDQAVTRSGEAG